MTTDSNAATILIVDDELQNRRLLEAMLRPEGYLTVKAANGADALASVAEQAPALILLDIMMPGMNGYEVASILKADPATAHIPIIMVTALIDREARLAGLTAGAEEFLTKPVDRAELWLRVRNLLRLKSYSELQDYSALLEQTVQTRTAELQRFRVAMDATADAITLLDRGTMRFVEVNATACTMLGYTREELLQMSPIDLGTGSGTLEQLENLYDNIIDGDSTKHLTETQLRRKDGSWFHAEVRRQAQRFGQDWIIVGVLRDITERKDAEIRLQHLVQLRLDVAARQASVLNALPAHIALLDTEGVIVSVNDAWQQFGSTNALQGEGKGIGLNYLDICDQAFGDEASQAHQAAAGIRSVLRGATRSFSFEYECHSPTQQRWFLMKVTPLANEPPDGAVVMHLDVTAERQSEENLRASELLFRQMAENISDVFFLRDADSGHTLYVSPAYEQIWGRTCASLYADPKSWGDAIHPDDRASSEESLKAGMTEGTFEFEHRIIRPDGSIRWIETRGFPVFGESSEVVRIAGIAKDITEDRLSAQKLRESERRFSDLLQNVELASVMLDREARITYCNDYLLRLTGWQHEEVIGRDWFELFMPIEVGDMKPVFLALLANLPEAWHRDNEILTRTGERRMVRWNNSVLRSAEGEVIGTASIGEDITEQKRAQESLHQLNANLEQRVIDRTADLEQARNDADAANQAKSGFLAAMSHEIRTPMNGVIGMADVLYQTTLNGYQLEMVDLIRESGFSLVKIIDDILDFSKIEASRLEIESVPISVAEVVERACALLDPLAIKKHVDLSLHIDPAMPASVLGDGLRLGQVLVNLIGNAIKFCSGRDQPGRVLVRAVLVEHDRQRAVMDISVTDNGIGMNAETQARLFTAFTQADASTARHFGGTGLGLLISRHLVELMQGDLTLQSVLKAGSSFNLRIAFAMSQARPDVIEPPSLVAGLCCVAIGSPTGLAGNIAAYLTQGGARVERAAGLAQARALMPALPPGPWIWIVDCATIEFELPQAQALTCDLTAHAIRFVAIDLKTRRQPHPEDATVVVVDGNVMSRRRLFRAVAIAAARPLEDEQLRLSGKAAASFALPSRVEALREGRLILVAEDNEINQKVIVRQLALLGFAADVASNGRLALEAWRGGDYALLLSDLHMPELDGYALATAIRDNEHAGRRIPILALTANALKDESARCRAAGMDAYLSKPLQLAELKSALETWLPNVRANATLRAQSSAAPGTGALIASAVDVSALESLIGDDPAIIDEFLAAFKISAAKIGLELSAACTDGLAAQAAKQAHKLKSSANTVGALALGALCTRMEDAGKARDTGALLALLPLFERELNTVNNFLDTFHVARPDRRQDG